MNTLRRLKLLYRERYRELQDIDAWNVVIEREWPKISAVVEAGERLRKYGKAGEGYTLAYDAAVKAWDKSMAEL